MTTARDIDNLIKAYLQVFPKEKAGLHDLLAHSSQHDDSIFSRKTTPGHITAAGFIIAKDTHRILLIEHGFLHLLLQPGGHYEPGDADTFRAALREIEEETGLSEKDLHYTPLQASQPLVPFDIDVQDIPENPNKGEPVHKHYDFRYVFLVDQEGEIHIDPEESDSFHWTELATFAAGEEPFKRVVQKVEQLKVLER